MPKIPTVTFFNNELHQQSIIVVNKFLVLLILEIIKIKIRIKILVFLTTINLSNLYSQI